MNETTPQERPCPICGRPALLKHRPFCSERCALVDLGRWLDGAYRIPDEAVPEAGGEETDEAN